MHKIGNSQVFLIDFVRNHGDVKELYQFQKKIKIMVTSKTTLFNNYSKKKMPMSFSIYIQIICSSVGQDSIGNTKPGSQP